MEILQASSYDLIDVLFLLKQCILDMNKKGFKQWNSAYPGSQVIKEDIEKGTLYIYKESRIIKGMLNLSDEMPEEYKTISWKGKTDKVLYVKRFAIHPFWKDTDISDKLMNFAEQYAEKNNFKSIRLDVLDSYPVDDKFYSLRSYEFAGTFHSEFQKIPYTCFEKNV